MKIAFYIHQTTISAGGIYTYTIGILRLLFNSPEIDKIVVITTDEISKTLDEFRSNKKIEIKNIDRKQFAVKLRMLLWYMLYAGLHILQEATRSPKIFEPIKKIVAKINPYYSVLAENKIDLFHVPLQYAPIYKIDAPVLVTMHDLQEYHFPTYFSVKERLHRKINNKISAQDSEHIICSFEHVKNDIVKYLKVNPEKVSVCPPPFADNWFLNKNETPWEILQTKYNIKRNYLLYPAATWKHKNHLLLIDAVKKIRNEGLDIELICTGNKTQFYETIQQKIESLELSQGINFLGIVPEEDLIGLYKNSSLVVIPTLYEAGSGPLYEAMRYNVPVICSNVTSLPDTVVNNNFLFDPNNIVELSEKIKRGLRDEKYRRENIENSKQRMEYFRKINYSDNFIKAYKKVLNK
jgi:glycosyltransferase involved in cell wall biosynthesis